MIETIASNKIGKLLAWNYVVEHWKELFKRLKNYSILFFSKYFLPHFVSIYLSFSGISFTLGRLVERVLKSFNTKYELDLVEKFIQTQNNLGIAEGAFKQAIENININVRWLNRNLERISAWLNQHVNLNRTK